MTNSRSRSATGALICALICALACALASCSDALLDEMTRIARAANEPTATPATGSTITAHETISLAFPAAMDAAAVALSGDLAASYAPTWSEDGKTIALNGGNVAAWAAGTGRSLTVAVTDGDRVVSFDFSYDVFDGACVSEGSNDANPGTAASPVGSVNVGIAKAAELYAGPSVVRVSKGTYSSDYAATGKATADVVEGVSLLGGFSPDSWAVRDATIYETVLEDSSVSGGDSLALANRAVFVPATVTQATRVEGFTIIMAGAGSNFGSAVYCAGSPTVTDCIIKGRQSGYGAINHCIVSRAGGVFSNNSIRPHGAGQTSYGVYLEESTATIRDNEILGGGGLTSAYGIVSMNGETAPRIEGNSINMSACSSPDIYCVSIALSHPYIEDNRFSFDQGDYAIYQLGAETSMTSSLRRNDFATKLTTWIRVSSSESVTCLNYKTQTVTTAEGTGLICDPDGWANYSSADGFGTEW